MMNRRKWLWAVLLALPLAVGSGLLYANSQTGGYVCPATGEVLPCAKCCPLNDGQQQSRDQSYTCPATGEELPCQKCCPLNDGQ